MSDPATFNTDLANIEVVPGDKFFIYITNHGTGGQFQSPNKPYLMAWISWHPYNGFWTLEERSFSLHPLVTHKHLSNPLLSNSAKAQ